MGLFRKKSENKGAHFNCHTGGETQAKGTADIKILGSGCAKCAALEEATRAALEELGMAAVIEHVTDFSQIASYGVMTTPALVVDGKVVSYGKVLKKETAKMLLQQARNDI